MNTSRETIEIIKSLALRGVTCSKISEITSVKYPTVWKILNKEGLKCSRGGLKVPLDEYDKIVQMYVEEKKTSREIGSIYGVAGNSIIQILRKRGVDIKTYSSYIELDKSCFSDNSESTSYYYGWLLTDGCLYRGTIYLKLQLGDIEILQGLKEYIKSSNKITTSSTFDKRTLKTYSYCSFSFSSTEVISRLRGLGLTERKSCKESCPSIFKYNRHFWRGVLDGDGCINAGKANMISLVGSESLLKDFLTFCKEVVGISRDYPITSNGKMKVIQICSYENCKKVLDHLYRDSNYRLTRKYETYLSKYADN